jgi:hypothetical protein
MSGSSLIVSLNAVRLRIGRAENGADEAVAGVVATERLRTA